MYLSASSPPRKNLKLQHRLRRPPVLSGPSSIQGVPGRPGMVGGGFAAMPPPRPALPQSLDHETAEEKVESEDAAFMLGVSTTTSRKAVITTTETVTEPVVTGKFFIFY